MIRFMLQKLIHKKWMVISLLIGNILLFAIACSNPMYKNAALQRTLTEDFNTYLQQNNEYPALASLQANLKRDMDQKEEYERMKKLSETFCDKLGLDQVDCIQSFSTIKSKANSLMEREDNQRTQNMTIISLNNMEEHVNVISGEMYTDKIDDDGTMEAIVSQRAFVRMNLLIGEVIEFPSIRGVDGKRARVRITGVFANKEENDRYWIKNPNSYIADCFISQTVFNNVFMNMDKQENSLNLTWHVLFDYTTIEPKQVDFLLYGTDRLVTNYSVKNKTTYFEKPKYIEILKEFQISEKKINTTLIILQIPVLALLCAFIFMISRQMLDLEQNEIALLKSRGSGRWQIILIYLLQSVTLSLASFLIGLPLGNFICRALGSTNGFLEFIQRRSLNVKLDVSVFLYCLAAFLISVGVMVLPVFKDSNVTIVNYKQKKNKRSKPFWQRAYFDVILLAVSLYGLYSFYDRKEALIAKMIGGSSLDPFLFICSSLFIISTAFVALRIQPFMVKLVYLIGRKRWKPALFASFLQILRTKGKQGFMMVFLMLTVALGIYNATVARTILSNAEKSIRYANGSDLVFQEVWRDNSAAISAAKARPDAGGMVTELVYTEPDSSRFENLDGVESMTKVMVRDDVTVNKVQDGNIKVMGINTDEFGKTTWFEDGLLPTHYFNYLNVLSNNFNAVLLSSNFNTNLNYKVGDTITFRNEEENSASITAVIYGFVDYWPSYIPETKVINENGELYVTDNYLIIGHLNYIQENWGLRPYQIWMKVKDSTQFIYDFANENNINFMVFKDVKSDLVDVRNDTMFQGTNGILTMSFIVVLVLCSAGFLIYWILSIRSRELLFGVFRAMGMRKPEIIGMLINEQIFSSGVSIATGAGIGFLASKLFVPLVQIFYASTDQAIPLTVIRQTNDVVRLFSVIVFVILICMVVLGVLISKIKISQALKLGED